MSFNEDLGLVLRERASIQKINLPAAGNLQYDSGPVLPYVGLQRQHAMRHRRRKPMMGTHAQKAKTKQLINAIHLCCRTRARRAESCSWTLLNMSRINFERYILI